jgi:hypothetical protein
MQRKDSAARRLHSLLEKVKPYWTTNRNLHGAWREALADDGLDMSLPEIQALLGSLLWQIKRDAMALDPNPPADATLVHFEQWAKACFGKSFDPSGTGLQLKMFVSEQSLSYLLTIAALVERDLGAAEIEADQIASLHEQAEDLLRDLRSDTTLPPELRLRLVHALTDVAESLRIYRATGAYGMEAAADSLVSTVAVARGTHDHDGVLRKVSKFARYLILVLRVGRVAADLIEGNVDEAIEGSIGVAESLEIQDSEA